MPTISLTDEHGNSFCRATLHAVHRASGRFGFSTEDLSRIAKRIIRRRSDDVGIMFLGRVSDGRTSWRVQHDGVLCRVVYSPHQKCIITVTYVDDLQKMAMDAKRAAASMTNYKDREAIPRRTE